MTTQGDAKLLKAFINHRKYHHLKNLNISQYVINKITKSLLQALIKLKIQIKSEVNKKAMYLKKWLKKLKTTLLKLLKRVRDSIKKI